MAWRIVDKRLVIASAAKRSLFIISLSSIFDQYIENHPVMNRDYFVTVRPKRCRPTLALRGYVGQRFLYLLYSAALKPPCSAHFQHPFGQRCRRKLRPDRREEVPLGEMCMNRPPRNDIILHQHTAGGGGRGNLFLY
jgi:hypothetical protein